MDNEILPELSSSNPILPIIEDLLPSDNLVPATTYVGKFSLNASLPLDFVEPFVQVFRESGVAQEHLLDRIGRTFKALACFTCIQQLYTSCTEQQQYAMDPYRKLLRVHCQLPQRLAALVGSLGSIVT